MLLLIGSGAIWMALLSIQGWELAQTPSSTPTIQQQQQYMGGLKKEWTLLHRGTGEGKIKHRTTLGKDAVDFEG